MVKNRKPSRLISLISRIFNTTRRDSSGKIMADTYTASSAIQHKDAQTSSSSSEHSRCTLPLSVGASSAQKLTTSDVTLAINKTDNDRLDSVANKEEMFTSSSRVVKEEEGHNDAKRQQVELKLPPFVECGEITGTRNNPQNDYYDSQVITVSKIANAGKSDENVTRNVPFNTQGEKHEQAAISDIKHGVHTTLNGTEPQGDADSRQQTIIPRAFVTYKPIAIVLPISEPGCHQSIATQVNNETDDGVSDGSSTGDQVDDRASFICRQLMSVPGVLIIDTREDKIIVYMSGERPNMDGVAACMLRHDVPPTHYQCEILPPLE